MKRLGRLLFAFALLAVGGLATMLSVSPTHATVAVNVRSTCGVERWSVKTLSDSAAPLVNRKPKATKVIALRALRAPEELGRRSRGAETTTYRVRAALVEMKIEDDDDIHLVIAQPGAANATMIVEFPAAGCTRRAPAWAQKAMATARAKLTTACGAARRSSFTHLRGTATVTGVGFFDFIHGQSGVAPNGIELHPVTGLTRITCKLAEPPPPPLTPTLETTTTAPPPPPPPATTSVTTTTTPAPNCAPSYPDVCIPPPPPDLDCKDIPFRNFRVIYNVPNPDPHRFDGDHDGIGCES